jgi:hypothetical protein
VTTAFLLHVNVLIALLDPVHVQHDQAHEWFSRVGHAQVSDSCLLALARASGGRLDSMDRRLVVDAVLGGRQSLELI